ncbi:MAG: sugar phosphate isomerase/epimerase [Clostridia bacterium]|nr:sugar phosphate isomerase/epimerase [Clostridia bacterium]
MLFSTQTDVLVKNFGLETAIEMFAKAGYPALDISLFDRNAVPFTDDYREVAEKLRAKADSLGVKFIQAHAPFIWKYEVYTGEIIPLLPRVFEFCSLLGVKYVVVHPIQNGRFYGREQEIFDLNVDFYKTLAPEAKKYGVKIAIENMWQTHPISRNICDDILADPHELARMYDTLADPEAFTVCLDLGHVALCGREPEDAIRIIGKERLGTLHVHDVDYHADLHTLPGISKINWTNVCAALADIGYEGSFNLEADNFYLGFPKSHYQTVTNFMADTCKVFVGMIEEMKEKKES